MSTNKSTDMITLRMRTDRAGKAKNMRVISKLANVKLVKLNGKKPDPRTWNPGGVTNMPTSMITHHPKVTNVRNMVKYLTIRTDHRL